MGVEIERKFLVDRSKLPSFHGGRGYEQFYLVHEPTVRVRIIEESRAYLTLKGKGTLSRPEYEYEIPVKDALELRAMALPHIIHKTRRLYSVGRHVWEVDEFHGALTGLWLAEIELRAEDEPFEMPPWAGLEVTEDARYTNAHLAEHGRPSPV